MLQNIEHDNESLIKKSFSCIWLIFILVIQMGCKKLVTVGSPNAATTSENIYTSDATAASVLTGIYAQLNANTPLYGQSINSISLVAGLSADEFTLFGGTANVNRTLVQYYINQLASGSSTNSPPSIWSDCYSKLYTINIALERLAVSNSLTPAVRKQLMGEARFLRAFFYFYLVNLYGDVPLTTTSNYLINSALSRNPQAQVYEQIIADLKDAQKLLSDGYTASDALSPTAERLRPNKWAATALLARAYLNQQQWDSAESQATAVINNTTLYSLCPQLKEVFLKNSTEAIWQMQPVNAGWNTEDARVFILPPTGPTGNSTVTGYPVYLSSQLMNSFALSDQRRSDWVDSVTVNGSTYYYSYKYKSAKLNAPVTEYVMVLRLAEQYLIKAEAEAQQDKINEAKADLNAIRNRAGLGGTMANDKSSLVAAILHERQVELFTEWGNRWLDLKRTNNVDAVMSVVTSQKGGNWNSNWQWYPIPFYDITQNSNLVQNTGY